MSETKCLECGKPERAWPHCDEWTCQHFAVVRKEPKITTITDDHHRIPIAAIIVNRDERQRRTIDSSDLQKSIAQVGLLNAIIVRRQEVEAIEWVENIPACKSSHTEYHLVAGERRLDACKALGHQDILCRFADELSSTEAAIIELEENLKRQDLPWQDIVAATAKIHALHVGLDADWSQAETAASLSLSGSTISMYLQVAAFLDDDRIAGCGSVREAYNVIARREQRKLGDDLMALLEEDDEKPAVTTISEQSGAILPENGMIINHSSESLMVYPSGAILQPGEKIIPPESGIIQADFLEWAPIYSGPKFNFIHCDFPYGTGDIGPQQLGAEGSWYEDDANLYWRLTNCLMTNLDRLLSVSGHVMFWFSERLGPDTRKALSARLSVQTHPLIWLHSDNAGISPDSRRLPRHIYDTALLASRGGRNIVQIRADAYAAPTDHRLHPSTKPEPMLRHFLSMLVDEQSSVLDPTCGSGAALRAAESLRASRVLGLELNEDYAMIAAQALKDARTMRRLEGRL